jgi:predicted RecB family nuclease
MPLNLITKIVKFRVKENLDKAIKKKSIRTCKNGHKYYKSSDCPTCPVCEQERKPQNGFLSLLAAPARRALENNGITTLQQLSRFTENEILALHGMGKSSIPKLQGALSAQGLKFKK